MEPNKKINDFIINNEFNSIQFKKSLVNYNKDSDGEIDKISHKDLDKIF